MSGSVRLIQAVIACLVMWAALTGCPTTPRTCNSTVCPSGCCDALGECHAPTAQQCGTSGQSCLACNLGSVCLLGLCVPPAGSTGGGGGRAGAGGGAGGGTGSTCSSSNCSGCCDGFGSCVPFSASATNAVCGAGGALCADCTSIGRVCSAASRICVTVGVGGGGGTSPCGPSTCSGCCDAFGTCVALGASATDTVCGGSGAACVNCANTGKVCDAVNRICVSGSTGGGSGTGCNPVIQTGCGSGEACMVTNTNTNATACLKGECDTVYQNCPNATDKCTYGPLIDGGVGRRCFASGTVAENQPCTRSGTTPQDDCAEGLICAAQSGGGSACRKMCYQGTNCSTGSQCLGVVKPPDQPGYQLTCTVLTSCDVLTQDCPTGQACYLVPDSATTCFPEGAIAVDGDCSAGNALCVKGAMCINGICKDLCNLDGGMPACSTPSACQALSTSSGQPLLVGACL